MDEREIRIETGEGEMTTFLAHPDGPGPFPLAVLFMGGVGYREQIRENARRFAAAGYYVAAPDLYRSGEGLRFDFARRSLPSSPSHSPSRTGRRPPRTSTASAQSSSGIA